MWQVKFALFISDYIGEIFFKLKKIMILKVNDLCFFLPLVHKRIEKS